MYLRFYLCFVYSISKSPNTIRNSTLYGSGGEGQVRGPSVIFEGLRFDRCYSGLNTTIRADSSAARERFRALPTSSAQSCKDGQKWPTGTFAGTLLAYAKADALRIFAGVTSKPSKFAASTRERPERRPSGAVCTLRT